MGLLFGLIFGIMDVEDASVYHIKQELLKEENYCIPIGLLLGAIAGFIGSVTETVFIILIQESLEVYNGKDGFKALQTCDEEI